jgi:hypothetical protein
LPGFTRPVTLWAYHDPDNGCDGALPYACGYMDPEHGIGTIMSYYAWSSNVWSDPDTLMDGRPAGTVTQDNAKALSLTLPRVRARRTQTVPEDAIIELDTPNVQAGVPIAGQTLVPDAMVELSSDNQASWVAAVSHGYSWSAPPEAHLQNWQNEPGPHDLWLRVNKGRPLWHETTVVETGIVAGTVTFRETGESATGVLVSAGGVATTTNELGHYSLFVAKATHTVSAVLRTADQSCTGQVEVEVLPNQAVAQPISVLCTPLSRAYIPLIPIGNQVSVSIQSFEGSQRAMNVRIVDLLGRAETLNSG